jgi:hypothetical protein
MPKLPNHISNLISKSVLFLCLLVVVLIFQNCSNQELSPAKNESVSSENNFFQRSQEIEELSESALLNRNASLPALTGDTLTINYCRRYGWQICFNKYQQLLSQATQNGQSFSNDSSMQRSIRSSTIAYQQYAYEKLQELHSITPGRTARLLNPTSNDYKFNIQNFGEFKAIPHDDFLNLDEGTYVVFFRPDFTASTDSYIPLMGELPLDVKFRPEDYLNANLQFPSGLHWHVGIMTVTSTTMQFYDCTYHTYNTGTETYRRNGCDTVSLDKLHPDVKNNIRTNTQNLNIRVNLIDEFLAGYKNNVIDFIKLKPSQEDQVRSARFSTFFNQSISRKTYSFWNHPDNFSNHTYNSSQCNSSNRQFSFDFASGYNCSMSTYKLLLKYYGACNSGFSSPDCPMQFMNLEMKDYLVDITNSSSPSQTPISPIKFDCALKQKHIWNIPPSSIFWFFIINSNGRSLGDYYGSLLMPQ